MSDVKQWMPLYIGAYLRNTQRLTTEQHGAYILLMMEYWNAQEPLPDDDDEFSLITRLPRERWLEMRGKLSRFFTVENGLWRHERIDAEIDKAEQKMREKAERMAKARAAKAAKSSITEPVTEPIAEPISDHVAELPSPSPSPSPVPKNEEPKRAADAAGVSRETKPSEIDEVRSIFREVLSEEITEALIKHRKKKRAAETPFAARLLVDQLKRCRDGPEEAAKEIILRNWVSIKADWNDDNRTRQHTNGKPQFSGVLANLREMLDQPPDGDRGRTEPIPDRLLVEGRR